MSNQQNIFFAEKCASQRKSACLKSLLLGIFLVFVAISFLAKPVLHAQNGSDQVKDKLNQKLAEIQEKIEVYRGQIQQKQKDVKTLNREIDILDAQAKKSELEIEQTELVINNLNAIIGGKENEISKYLVDINKNKAEIAEYLRLIHEYDQKSLSEIILRNENFSDFLDEVQTLEDLQEKVQKGVKELNSLKQGLEDDKRIVEEEREQYSQVMMLQEAQRRALRSQEQQKSDLLDKTKGQESLFSKLMSRAHSDIASVRNQIYLLDGVGLRMTLEEAMHHAVYASSKTGVRPALLLAVLKKESSWGTNVGTGYWRADMHPRDHEAYLTICKQLGLDPDSTPVSRKPSYGWGGAMGPAQFLPATWLSYADRIAQVTGHNPPSPWNIDDAFVAAGIKLSSNGASAGSYNTEWKAAMIYFAGSRWNNPVYRFYGDSVMELAAVIQEQLDAIEGN